jgi:hypothetical protein
MFIGYKIKKSDTKFKYSAGNIEFVFCFLSRYPILYLKTTTGLQDLKDIRTASQMFFQTNYQVAEKDIDTAASRLQLAQSDRDTYTAEMDFPDG